MDKLLVRALLWWDTLWFALTVAVFHGALGWLSGAVLSRYEPSKLSLPEIPFFVSSAYLLILLTVKYSVPLGRIRTFARANLLGGAIIFAAGLNGSWPWHNLGLGPMFILTLLGLFLLILELYSWRISSGSRAAGDRERIPSG